MKRRLVTSFALVCVLALGVVGYWVADRLSGPVARRGAFDRSPDGIRVVATDTHRALPSTSPAGARRAAPALPSLEQAIGLDSRVGFAVRLEVVHGLQPAGLDGKQADALLAFVAEKRRPAGLTAGQCLALKNDILNVLAPRADFAASVAATLRAVRDDPAQDPGLRDYALQALSDLAGAAGPGAQWRAAEGADPALAATAMLQLLAFSRQGKLDAGDRDRLAQAAFRLASDPARPEPCRATALQVCGGMKFAGARRLAGEIARSDKTGMPLRIAAVATLGDLGGDAAAREYLVALTTGKEKRLRLPAQSALKRFSIIN